MQRPSELVLRNTSVLPKGPVLLLNPPRDGLFRELEAAHNVTAYTQDYGDFEWLRTSGAEVRFGLLPWMSDHTTVTPAPEPGSTATIILFLPREKDRLDMLLHACANGMGETAQLWLVGENRAGIKSAARRLDTRFRRVEKLESARHCVLFRAAEPVPGTPFDLADYRQQWELELPPGLPGGVLRIESLPGVFAHGRLDGGTALLLQFLGQNFEALKISGHCLDFGCGAGIIGLALLRANPDLDMTLVDSNAAALLSAARSLQANGLASAPPTGDDTAPAEPVSESSPRVQLVAADGLPPDGPALDWIISNPPFHQGVDTDYDVARHFFTRAAARLAKSGKMLLVCNRHLPYENWLKNSFQVLEKPAENREFKILLARRPRA